MAAPASLVSIATLEPVRIDDEFYELVAQLLAIRGGDDINDRCCTIPRPGGDRATTVGTLRRFNERRLVVARKRTHEISNVNAVELISADPHEEYRDRGRSHPMTTDAAWVVHEWTYSGTVVAPTHATMQRHLAQLRLPSRRRFTTAQARDQGLPCARLLSAR